MTPKAQAADRDGFAAAMAGEERFVPLKHALNPTAWLAGYDEGADRVAASVALLKSDEARV